jgi:hypothetical protein
VTAQCKKKKNIRNPYLQGPFSGSSQVESTLVQLSLEAGHVPRHWLIDSIGLLWFVHEFSDESR